MLGTSGNVFDSPLAPIDSSSTLYRAMLHSWNLNATDRYPVRASTVRPVARSEERNRDTKPTPRFATIPSTRNSLFPAEGAHPQNYMVHQRKLHFSELHFDKFPTPSTSSCWKISSKTQVSACFGSPSEAMLWIKEVEMVDPVDDLKSSHSIQWPTYFPNFEMLDAKIAPSLTNIIQNSNFKKRVNLAEQKPQLPDRFLCGRQALMRPFLIFQIYAGSLYRATIRF